MLRGGHCTWNHSRLRLLLHSSGGGGGLILHTPFPNVHLETDVCFGQRTLFTPRDITSDLISARLRLGQ